MGKKKSYKSPEPCVVTGECRDGYVTLHHLITKKSRPDLKDESWNLFPCSSAIHVQFHAHGTSWMAREYPAVKEWLESNGWEYDQFLGRWSHYKEAKLILEQ